MASFWMIQSVIDPRTRALTLEWLDTLGYHEADIFHGRIENAERPFRFGRMYRGSRFVDLIKVPLITRVVSVKLVECFGAANVTGFATYSAEIEFDGRTIDDMYRVLAITGTAGPVNWKQTPKVPAVKATIWHRRCVKHDPPVRSGVHRWATQSTPNRRDLLPKMVYIRPTRVLKQ